MNIGIDLGNGYSKISINKSECDKTKSKNTNFLFANRISTGHTSLNNNVFNVRYGGTDCTIGSPNGRIIFDNTKEDNINMLLLKVCIALAMEDKEMEEVNIVAGLPIDFYDNYKNKFLETIKKVGMVDNFEMNGIKKSFTIKDAIIFPQSAIVFDEPKTYENRNVIVIDIGMGNINISEWMDLSKVSSNTFKNGCYELYSSIAKRFNNDHGTNIKPFNIERCITSKKLKLYGDEVDMTDIINEAVEATVDEIRTYIDTSFDIETADNILICGGGANIFGEALKYAYKNAEIKNNQFINSDTFLSIANRKFKDE